MLKPICVPCQRFFRPKRTGFSFIEGMPVGQNVQPGTAEPDRWEPYKLWQGDIWHCEGCGAEIISGTGRQPIAIQHETDFTALTERLGATFQVNDC